jgi:hypothetical protein
MVKLGDKSVIRKIGLIVAGIVTIVLVFGVVMQVRNYYDNTYSPVVAYAQVPAQIPQKVPTKDDGARLFQVTVVTIISLLLSLSKGTSKKWLMNYLVNRSSRSYQEVLSQRKFLING